MKPYQDIPLRRARDRMIDLLFPSQTPDQIAANQPFEPGQSRIGAPIRDLPVAYQRKTPFGQSVAIYLLGGQASMIYTLCNKEGIPIETAGNQITGELITLADLAATALEEVFEVITATSIYPEQAAASIPVSSPEEQANFLQTWPQLVRLNTPEIVEDGTYTILGTNTDATGQGIGLSEYLHEPVVLWVGLKTNIPTRFLESKATDQLQNEQRTLTIDYDQPARDGLPLRIELSGCQEHLYYQVLEIQADGSRVARSAAVRTGLQVGDEAIQLTLELYGEFKEDSSLVVRAFKYLKNRDVEDILLAVDVAYPLEVWVRPDPRVPFTLSTQPLPFGKTPMIAFEGTPAAQASVTYELCALPLRLSYSYEQESATYSPNGRTRVGAFAPFFHLFSQRFQEVGHLAWQSGIDPEASRFTAFFTAFLHQFQAELIARNQLGELHPQSVLDRSGTLLPAAVSAFFGGLLSVSEVSIDQSLAQDRSEMVMFHPYDLVQANGNLREEVMSQFFVVFDQLLAAAMALGEEWQFLLRHDYSMAVDTFNLSLQQILQAYLQRTDVSDSLDTDRFLQGSTFSILVNAFYQILFGDTDPDSFGTGGPTFRGDQLQSLGNLPLEEDHLLLIKASKPNGTWLFLEQMEVVLVEPDPEGPRLRTEVDSRSGKLRIVLENPQRRVGYQLREIGGAEIGPTMLPGADRGVGWEAHGRRWGMRLRDTPKDPPVRPDLSTILGDIQVSSPGQTKAELFPGDSLSFVPFLAKDGQEFEVLLIKEYSGVRQVLNQKIVFRPSGRRVRSHNNPTV